MPQLFPRQPDTYVVDRVPRVTTEGKESIPLEGKSVEEETLKRRHRQRSRREADPALVDEREGLGPETHDPTSSNAHCKQERGERCTVVIRGRI